MRKYGRISLITIILILFTNIYAAPAGKNFIWKAVKEENTIYLAGSIHAGDMSMYPLSDAYWKSLNESDAIAVEADIYAEMEGFAAAEDKEDSGLTGSLISMLGKMFYADGDSLQNHLTPATYNELNTFFKSFDEDSSPFGSLMMGFGISKLKPGILALVLEAMSLQKTNLQPELGIDYAFLKQAHHRNQPVIELEGMEQQLTIFLNMSDKAAEYILNDSIKRMKESEKELKELVKLWVKGDDKKILKMFKDTGVLGFEEFNQEFLISRNNTMFSKSMESLQNYPTLFVVVGAAHLLGDDGLIEMFKDAGFKVTRL
ncbi:MAG: TraB/GumN family protein [Candidatus Cloacimonetes bacterium]|nr:TraB/GumN family protein [Candidatus Cloacimonadota bacterium]